MYKQLRANRNRAQGYASDATDEDIWDKNGHVRFDGQERSQEKKRRAEEIVGQNKRQRRN